MGSEVSAIQGEQRVSSQDRLLALVRQMHPDYHPVVAMVSLAYNSEEEGIQLACHREVAKYVVAVDRFVEVKTEVRKVNKVVVELFSEGPQGQTPVLQQSDGSQVLEAPDRATETRTEMRTSVRSSVSVTEDEAHDAVANMWRNFS